MKSSLRRNIRTRRHSVQFHKVHNYLVGEQLSKGTFSLIYSVFKQESHQPFAMKLLLKKRLDTYEREMKDLVLFNEKVLLPILKHTFIIDIKETIENQTQIIQVMNIYRRGDFANYIEGSIRSNSNNKTFNYAETLFLIDQVLAAVEFLHSIHICHRDLKPNNILISDDGKKAVLTDFGLADFCIGARKKNIKCGSYGYTAPEVIQGEEYDGIKADVWSIGILIYALIVGPSGFGNVQNDDNPQNISSNDQIFDIDYSKLPSNEISDLIRKILRSNPEERPTVSEIRSHPAFDVIPANSRMMKTEVPDLSKKIFFKNDRFLNQCQNLTVSNDSYNNADDNNDTFSNERRDKNYEIMGRLSKIMNKEITKIQPKLTTNKLTKEKVLFYLLDRMEKMKYPCKTSQRGNDFTIKKEMKNKITGMNSILSQISSPDSSSNSSNHPKSIDSSCTSSVNKNENSKTTGSLSLSCSLAMIPSISVSSEKLMLCDNMGYMTIEKEYQSSCLSIRNKISNFLMAKNYCASLGPSKSNILILNTPNDDIHIKFRTIEIEEPEKCIVVFKINEAYEYVLNEIDSFLKESH